MHGLALGLLSSGIQYRKQVILVTELRMLSEFRTLLVCVMQATINCVSTTGFVNKTVCPDCGLDVETISTCLFVKRAGM